MLKIVFEVENLRGEKEILWPSRRFEGYYKLRKIRKWFCPLKTLTRNVTSAGFET